MGQSLFRKHSKFQNFDEIFHCGMTKLEDTILNYCGLCRYVELLNQINPFRNHLKFQKFFAVT